jgi:calcineurin-like phosphoesterase family protein
MEIYFTSDTHFGHRNIIKYCDRPFSSVEEMDETLIQNWNSVVGPRDTIYHLGDFAMGREDPKVYFNRLNGNKFLLAGSHDTDKVFQLKWGWVKDVYYLRWQRIRIWMAHHAHRVWPKSHHGVWHLFGHSHGALPPLGLSFDIGMEGHNFTPWAVEEIEEKMEQLSNMIVQ